MSGSRKQAFSQMSLFLGGCQLTVNKQADIPGLTFDVKLPWDKRIRSRGLVAYRKVTNKLDCPMRECCVQETGSDYHGVCVACLDGCLCNISSRPNKSNSYRWSFIKQYIYASVQHRREVAAVVALYKMYIRSLPPDLRALLPPHIPCVKP